MCCTDLLGHADTMAACHGISAAAVAVFQLSNNYSVTTPQQYKTSLICAAHTPSACVSFAAFCCMPPCITVCHKLLCCCRWLSADGSKQMGAAWGTPEEVLRLPQGVRSVSAGLHSSAAISRDRQLWMWGKVISKVSSAAVCRQCQPTLLGHHHCSLS